MLLETAHGRLMNLAAAAYVLDMPPARIRALRSRLNLGLKLAGWWWLSSADLAAMVKHANRRRPAGIGPYWSKREHIGPRGEPI